MLSQLQLKSAKKIIRNSWNDFNAISIAPWLTHGFLTHTCEQTLKDYECVFIFNHVQPKVIYCPLQSSNALTLQG